MVTSQILKNCLEELRAISRTEFCLQDPVGTPIVVTEGAAVPEQQVIAAFAESDVDSQIIGNRYFLKVMDEDETAYVLTAIGDNDYTLMVARMAVSELQNLLVAYKEKYDRNNFFQNLMLDNLLLVDIHNRAKKLHIPYQVPRVIIIFEIEKAADTMAQELLSRLYTSQNGDYLTEVDENSIILIKSVRSETDYATAQEAATVAVDMLNTEAMLKVRASFGSIAGELKDLSKSYKEARMAMDVGGIFYAEKRVISYGELGIGRLIYQLPVNLCEMFINEIFGTSLEENLDNETLTTINTFFENSLNVSETSRKLFIHRNTLVYRIEKLQKSTGLDIRTFEDALTFKIALMVVEYMNYLKSRE